MSSIDRPEDGINTNLYVQVPLALLDSGIESGALITYMAIRRQAWHVGSYHQDGTEALAAATGLSRRTVTRHLQALEDVCAVAVDRRGARNTNVITVLPYEGIVSLPDPVCAETPVSHHNEVMGHQTLCDETPVSPTTGHGCLIRIEEDTTQKMTEEGSQSYVHTHSDVEEEGRDRFAVVLDEVPGGTPDGASASPRSTSGPWCGYDDGWWLIETLAERRDEFLSVVGDLVSRAHYGAGVVLALIRGAWTRKEHPSVEELDTVIDVLRRALAAEIGAVA